MKPQSTLKTLAKALPPIPNRALRSSVAAALILHFTLYTLHSHAAEPLSWVRKPNQPAPEQLDTFHGESIDFRCTFTGFGALPFAEGADVRLWYQTNGMGKTWFSIPATVSSNVLSATFTPDRDPGAERLAVFFGAPSNAYAAAQVRFRNSPGATPNHLDPPSVLDWQAELSAATNVLWAASADAFMPQSNAYTKTETDARIAELAPLGITTNDVCNIVTNEVAGTFEPWVWPDIIYADYEDTRKTYYYAPTSEWLDNFGDHDREYYVLAEASYSPEINKWNVCFCPMIWDGAWQYWPSDMDYYANVNADANATSLNVVATNEVGFVSRFDLNRTYTPRRNALGLARLTDIQATVTNMVRSVAYAVNDYVWDGDVCWRRQMLQGGYLEYVAVTNIDVTLPENYKALEALERARRNQE